MSQKSFRSLRLNQLVQRAVANIISNELRDPRVLDITVSHVKVSADLSFADVYIMPSDSTTLRVLNQVAGFFSYHVAKKVKVRKVPKFRFYADDSLDKIIKIDRLLALAEAKIAHD